MTTGNKAQRLKYLGVEMLRVDATKSSKPEVGLFLGLRDRSNGDGVNAKTLRFILLGVKDKENDLTALNMAIFNVLSIKMLYNETKELIVFKNTAADQEKAVELLEVALAEFQKEERMVDNDPEIVDIKTFDDVPTEFFSAQQDKSKTSGTGNNYGYGVGGGMYSTGNGYQNNNNDWKEKQEEREKEKKRQEAMRWTPTTIKRISELPTLKILNSIKKKVAAIAAGEYKGTLIDPDPTDTVEKKKTKGTAV